MVIKAVKSFLPGLLMAGREPVAGRPVPRALEESAEERPPAVRRGQGAAEGGGAEAATPFKGFSFEGQRCGPPRRRCCGR